MPKRKSQEKASAAPAAKRVKVERTLSALELLPPEVFLSVLDHVDSPVTIFALQLTSRTLLRRTKRPNGVPIGVRRRRPWPERISTEGHTYETYRAAVEKLQDDFYRSKTWHKYVDMRFDMWSMSLASENESRRRSFRSLTCSMCGKVKSVGVDGFADVRFSNKIKDRECIPCSKSIRGLSGDALERKLCELDDVVEKNLALPTWWNVAYDGGLLRGRWREIDMARIRAK